MCYVQHGFLMLVSSELACFDACEDRKNGRKEWDEQLKGGVSKMVVAKQTAAT